MLLHAAISDIASRRDRIHQAIAKGHLTPELSRYAQPNWAYVLKQTGTPALAYPQVGNYYEADEDAGAISYVVTTDDEDRDGDIVRPMGAQLHNYSVNPIVFFGHQEKPIPIGVCRSPDGRITVYPEENRVIDTVHFDRADPDADFIYGKCLRKILNATSIAFVPTEAWRRGDVRKARQHNEQQAEPGWYFNLWDKTEVSIVGVPSNPKAVGLQKDLMGACRDVWDREWSDMSPQLRKAWRPYIAQAKGCWGGWCPLPGDEKDIGGGVVLKAVRSKSPEEALKIASKGPNKSTKKSTKPEFAEQIHKVAEELAESVDPAPMPGYGQVFRGSDNQLWYVGGDGDEDGFADLVQEKLGQFGEVTYEAEGFPPEDEGWEQLYPEQKMHTSKASGMYFVEKRPDGWYAVLHDEAEELGPYKSRAEAVQAAEGYEQKSACDCADCQQGKACPCGKQQKASVDGKSKFKGHVHNRTMATKAYRAGPYEVRGNDSDGWHVFSLDGNTIVSDDYPTEAEAKREAQALWQEEHSQGTKSMRKAKDVECPRCKGSGVIKVSGEERECPRCNGAGVIFAASRKSTIQADVEGPGVPGRNANPEEKALSQSDGRAGGYTVPAEKLDDPQTPGWAACGTCHGDGNCGTCEGTGEIGGSECTECGGSGECSDCAGEGHVEKSVHKKSYRRKQLEETPAPQPSVPQVIAALYSHAKAEAAYIDQLNDTYKSTLGQYRDAMGKRVESLKQMFADLSPDDDIEKLCKSFEDEHDGVVAEKASPTQQPGSVAKLTLADGTVTYLTAEDLNSMAPHLSGMLAEGGRLEPLHGAKKSVGPDDVVEPGEAGLVEQGQIPEGETFGDQETFSQRELRHKSNRRRIMKQDQAPADGSYIEEEEPFDKAAPGTEEWAEEELLEPEHKEEPTIEEGPPVEEGPVLEEKAGGVCMCGAEVPEGATECPGCGEPLAEEPLPELKQDDPASEEILERYRHPKSLKWATRKWLIHKSLVPFLKHRTAANGQKYLVRSKQAEELDEDEVKALTTKLAGAIDDLKSLVKSTDLPRKYKAALKHVADTVWYVGKALTDKGKEQRNGGKGSELSDKGKEQRNGGAGTALSDKGQQQGKTPSKSFLRQQADPELVQKYQETVAKLRRFGIFNGR